MLGETELQLGSTWMVYNEVHYRLAMVEPPWTASVKLAYGHMLLFPLTMRCVGYKMQRAIQHSSPGPSSCAPCVCSLGMLLHVMPCRGPVAEHREGH